MKVRTADLITAALLSVMVTGSPAMAATTDAFSTDYSRLVELITLEDKLEPLYIFNDLDEEFDPASHEANLNYFNTNPGLLEKIRSNLNDDPLHWQLGKFEHRLLFVPEEREEYAGLYERYCHEVIQYILGKTRLSNPIGNINTLLKEKPDIPDISDQPQPHGVTAFLVHNIAKESVWDYVFSNSKQKRLKIVLNNKIFVGEVGSYTTQIHIRENGRFEFKKNSYTIWQNSARNPYTALMVPVEETLHIALRTHTEEAIKASLGKRVLKKIEDVRKIVEDWISVEEAIVGGVVHALLPDILSKYAKNLSSTSVALDLEMKSRMDRYRYLKKGIGIVSQLGYEKSLNLYQSDPAGFKALLTEKAAVPGTAPNDPPASGT